MSRKDRARQLHRLVALLFLLMITGWQVLLFSIAIWGILPPHIDWSVTWGNTEKFSGVLRNVATIAAFVVGGIWTYYLFIKGRVLKSRLEPKVAGEIVSIGTQKYIRISVELKNVGSSRVAITRGKYLYVFAQRPHGEIPTEDAAKYMLMGTHWKELLPFDILTRHDWIEPAETIQDQILVEILIKEEIGYRVDLVIFAGGMRWKATSIVSRKPKHQSTDDSQTGEAL
ncbi:MAG TPA: hypothetical protein VJ875_19045 [Pyrinomonadaceae bacterium]|nr:hypothetical protein [Pyrinomonadaceae bacterium]